MTREADLLQEGAVEHLVAGRADLAHRDLQRVVELHAAAGRALEEAKARYAAGLLESHLLDRPVDAERSLSGAFEGFEREERADLAARAASRLGVLAWRAGDLAVAGTRLREAEDRFAATGDDAAAFDAQQLQAFLLLLAGDRSGAFDGFVRAIESARGAGRDDDALSLSLNLRVLVENRLVDGQLPAPSIEETVAAAADGARTLGGYELLSRSSTHIVAGRSAEALTDAEAARQVALGGPDPVLYLLACTSIAAVHEHRGEDAEVRAILLTCAASLADLLGPSARRPVDDVLTSVERRWGASRTERARKAYRNMVEAGGAER